jgi:hypothetical protein
MNTTIETAIKSAAFADYDDSLSACAADYAATHGLESWHVEARWADDSREEIVLTVNALALYRSGNDKGRGFDPGADDVLDAAEALCADPYSANDVLHTPANTSEIAIVRTEEGAIVGIGGDGAGKGAWAVELVAAP